MLTRLRCVLVSALLRRPHKDATAAPPTDRAATPAWLCAFFVAVAGATGCTTPPTQLVVVVDTDLAVPTEVATIVLRLRRANGGLIEEASVAVSSHAELPLSLAVVPPEGDVSATVLVEAEARDASGAVVVVTTARTGFVAERSLLLRVLLTRSCLGITCGAGETCIERTCVSDFVDPSTLPPVIPGQERRDAGRDAAADAEVDAGVIDGGPTDGGPRDGGLVDGGPVDGGPVDGGPVDGGPIDGGPRDGGPRDGGPRDGGPPAVPRSCVEVRDAGGASGVHAIDPDGPGGLAPFDVYCENTANGGGWTLIAKVAPTSTLLRYDDAPWTGTVALAFGDPSILASGEALLASYWTLPVSELRLGMTDAAGTRWATATLDRTTALRAAMDLPGAVALAGLDMPAWNALAGATFTDACMVARLGASMVNARVRIGVLVAGASPCGMASTAYAYVGYGAANDTWSGCSRYNATAGGAQPCGGPPSFRFEHPAFGVVMAR